MSEKKTIGILYIATGPYIAFWNRFYDTFEEFFLPNTEKHYMVFTDAKDFYQSDNERVHVKPLKSEPWPLPTLMKFHTFLEYKDELSQFDYLYQSNANIICLKEVKEDDFLPREDKGEELMFTLHPGYYTRNKIYYPYDRNRKCLAYVPYNCGGTFVFGAMNGGTSKGYLSFISELDSRIVEDLKKGIIAKWHDESHVNHYVIGKSNYRLLPFAFCYPVGFDVPGDKIITGVEKKTVFDVDSFKGVYQEDNKGLSYKIKRAFRGVVYYVLPCLRFVRDFLLFRKPN